MKRAKKLLASLSIITLSLGIGAPVFANGGDHSWDSSNDRQSHHSWQSDDSDNNDRHQERSSWDRQGNDRGGWWWWAWSGEGKHKKHHDNDESAAERCERQQSGLDKSIARSNAHQAAKLSMLDKIYSSMKDYVTDRDLTVADYDQLTQDADTTKITAQDELTALEAIDANLNCDDLSDRSGLDEYKAQRTETLETLKAYKAQLSELFEAIKTAAEAR